jgi:hypothetical protein
VVQESADGGSQQANLAMQSSADGTKVNTSCYRPKEFKTASWLLAALLFAGPRCRDKTRQVRCRRAAAQRGLDAARKVTRSVDRRRGIVIVSDGLPPLTSSSFQVVSSTLVTLPLGPRVQN